MKKPQFVTNRIYHIYNRGVEKRKIFLDNQDRFRFLHDIFEFNNKNPVLNVKYYFSPKNMEVQPPYLHRREPRKLLVEILAFILMPNHYHLLLKQKKNNGIVKFMQKLGTGYTMYFNKKYERVGPLFQGRFKAIHISKEEYFEYVVYYIHFNPLDLKKIKWREGKIKNYQKAIKFLDSYRWSSHLDYTGKKNFPSLTQREFLLNVFGGEKSYKKNVKEWLKEIAKRKDVDESKLLKLN